MQVAAWGNSEFGMRNTESEAINMDRLVILASEARQELIPDKPE